MLSKSELKLITSLKQKKYRLQHQLFVAEGKKTILELLNSKLQLHQLYTTTLEFDVPDVLQTKITPKELDKISFLKTPTLKLKLGLLSFAFVLFHLKKEYLKSFRIYC